MLKMIARIRQRQRSEPLAPAGPEGVILPDSQEADHAAVEQGSIGIAAGELPAKEASASAHTEKAPVSSGEESASSATLPGLRDTSVGLASATQSEPIVAIAPAGQQKRRQPRAGVQGPHEVGVPVGSVEDRQYEAAVPQESTAEARRKDSTRDVQIPVREHVKERVARKSTDKTAGKSATGGKSGRQGRSNGKGREQTDSAADEDPEMAARKRLPGHPLGKTEKLSLSVPLRICLYDGSGNMFLSPQVYACAAELYYGPTEQHPHLVLWEDRIRAQVRLLGIEQLVLKDRSLLQVVAPPAEVGEPGREGSV